MQTLRIVAAACRRGIAVIDGDHEPQLVVRIDGDAHAGRGQRIGGTAARQVGGGDRRPAPGAVQEIAAALADDELGVGGELTELDGHLVVEHVLLEPHLEQARGVGRFEIGDRHQRADIGGGDRVAVDLIAVGEEAEPAPTDGLLHVDIHVELEHAVILAALVEAAPIVERLAVIVAADADAGARQGRARSTDIGLEGRVVGNAGVGHVAIGAGLAGKRNQCCRNGDRAKYQAVARFPAPPAGA